MLPGTGHAKRARKGQQATGLGSVLQADFLALNQSSGLGRRVTHSEDG